MRTMLESTEARLLELEHQLKEFEGKESEVDELQHRVYQVTTDMEAIQNERDRMEDEIQVEKERCHDLRC